MSQMDPSIHPAGFIPLTDHELEHSNSILKSLMKSPIFIVGPHRSGSTLWHNLVSMCPSVMRLTDPRFLGERGRNDFQYFLKTQAGDLSIDENVDRSEEHTSELQSLRHLVCRLLLEKKKQQKNK